MAFEAEIRKGDVSISKNKDRIIINLNDKITFDSGSAELKPEAKRILEKLEGALKKVTFNKVIIEGNTDSEPIRNRRFRNNWHLSTERALSVLDHILETSNLNPEFFQIGGYGEYNPIPGVRDKGKNRRVDIVVFQN